MFTQKDLKQIESKGISLDDLNRQIKFFKTGFPFADIIMPATPAQGIIILSEGDEKHYSKIFDKNSKEFKITRFIPASGAASRMFKALFEALEKLQLKSAEDQNRIISETSQLETFLNEIGEYPFFADLNLSGTEEPVDILEMILSDKGLNYGLQPKGLLKFHKYDYGSRTAFEEHLREASAYCGNKQGIVYIHLTVSPDHEAGFKELAKELVPELEEDTGLSYDISFSFQKPETDTLAVDLDNNPFRNADGSLLFRPGGHGALIQNLNAIDSDLMFISNIDNVGPDRVHETRIHYKKVLGGILLETRSKIFYYLSMLYEEQSLESEKLHAIVSYIHEKLGVSIPDRLLTWESSDLRQWLINKLDRPIRICGMVKNEGEPGGGPFYVCSANGEISLQIVESSQIDISDEDKLEVLKESSHFNPVDLVCSTRNYKGEKFNLVDFIDHNTGFIAKKSLHGRDLKALELPGLWNGAMADWLTLFVDVPIETFSPVKTVFDLRREEHIA